MPVAAADLLAHTEEIAQPGMLVEGLHDLVIGDRRGAAGPVQVGPVVIQPHGAHHRGEHDAVLLALDSQHVGSVTALAGVQHVEGALGHVGEHRHLHRLVGLDDRGQPMLSIDEYTVDVEGDALMGDQPVAAAHRLGEPAHHRPGQGTVGGVRFQPISRACRCDRLHPAPHPGLLLRLVSNAVPGLFADHHDTPSQRHGRAVSCYLPCGTTDSLRLPRLLLPSVHPVGVDDEHGSYCRVVKASSEQ